MIRILQYIFVLLLLGCNSVSETEIDFPFEGDPYTVYSLISSNDSSYFAAFVNKAVLEEFINVETQNFQFTIKEDRNDIVTFDLGESTDGHFYYPFEANKNYTLEINVEVFNFESELITMPENVEIDSVNIIPYDRQDAIDVEIFFEDSPNADYYSVLVETYFQGEMIEPRISIPDLRSCIEDIDFKNTATMHRVEEVDISPFTGVIPPPVADSIEIILYTISQEMCEFSQDLIAPNQLLNSISEQEEGIFGNIDGARGIFAGFSKSRVGIKL